MKKIRLDPDHLRVESFATAIESRNRGTVAAHQQTYQGCEFTYEVDCTHVGIFPMAPRTPGVQFRLIKRDS